MLFGTDSWTFISDWEIKARWRIEKKRRKTCLSEETHFQYLIKCSDKIMTRWNQLQKTIKTSTKKEKKGRPVDASNKDGIKNQKGNQKH